MVEVTEAAELAESLHGRPNVTFASVEMNRLGREVGVRISGLDYLDYLSVRGALLRAGFRDIDRRLFPQSETGAWQKVEAAFPE